MNRKIIAAALTAGIITLTGTAAASATQTEQPECQPRLHLTPGQVTVTNLDGCAGVMFDVAFDPTTGADGDESFLRVADLMSGLYLDPQVIRYDQDCSVQLDLLTVAGPDAELGAGRVIGASLVLGPDVKVPAAWQPYESAVVRWDGFDACQPQPETPTTTTPTPTTTPDGEREPEAPTEPPAPPAPPVTLEPPVTAPLPPATSTSVPTPTTAPTVEQPTVRPVPVSGREALAFTGPREAGAAGWLAGGLFAGGGLLLAVSWLARRLSVS